MNIMSGTLKNLMKKKNEINKELRVKFFACGAMSILTLANVATFNLDTTSKIFSLASILLGSLSTYLIIVDISKKTKEIADLDINLEEAYRQFDVKNENSSEKGRSI